MTRTPNQPSQYLVSCPPCSKEIKRIPGPYSVNVCVTWVEAEEENLSAHLGVVEIDVVWKNNIRATMESVANLEKQTGLALFHIL